MNITVPFYIFAKASAPTISKQHKKLETIIWQTHWFFNKPRINVDTRIYERNPISTYPAKLVVVPLDFLLSRQILVPTQRNVLFIIKRVYSELFPWLPEIGLVEQTLPKFQLPKPVKVKPA